MGTLRGRLATLAGLILIGVASTGAGGAGAAIGHPSPPRSVAAVAGNGWVSVSWEAPLDDGGAPILDYHVWSDPVVTDCWVAASGPLRCTIDGLENGLTYTFSVTATNEEGLANTAWSGPVAIPTSPPTGEFTSLTPARILDTRTGNGRDGVTLPVEANETISVRVTGRGGVAASGVSAVVMNVTVTQPTDGGYLTVWPKGVERPLVSNLNFVPGQTVPNLVTVAVGSGGEVNVFNRFGTVHVIFDVVGFYSDDEGPIGSRFHSIDNPYRYFDTRTGRGGIPAAPLGPDGTLAFNVLGKGGVPASGVTGVVMNVTVTQPTRSSFLTVYPGDAGSRPTASNLNYTAGLTVPNLVTVRVPPSGIVNFYNRFGAVHVLADVVGYYDDDRSGEAGRFIGMNPLRIFDSRADWWKHGPLCEDCWVIHSLSGWWGVPEPGAGTAVLNVTATAPTAPSFFTAFPADLCVIPLASNLNFGPGQTVPNHVIVRLSEPFGCDDPDFPSAFGVYNRFGNAHEIVDLFGYFTDDTAYTYWGRITDDTGAISIERPLDWTDVHREPDGTPPEPRLSASWDLDLASRGGTPAVWVEASRQTIYPTTFEFLISRDLSFLDSCASRTDGTYDDGVYRGDTTSGERCINGNIGFDVYALERSGSDFYVLVTVMTFGPIDEDAGRRILTTLDVTPWP